MKFNANNRIRAQINQTEAGQIVIDALNALT